MTRVLEASTIATLSVPSGRPGASFDIAVEGAELGDFVLVSCDKPLFGCSLTGYVNEANAVNVTLLNLTGSAVTFENATFRTRVEGQGQ